MVRYMGCGANRVSREPPVSRSPLEPCWQKRDDGILSWMRAMCDASGQNTGSCRLPLGGERFDAACFARYGPFWAVYSHPAFSLYGYRSQEEKEVCLRKKEEGLPRAQQCADPQAPWLSKLWNCVLRRQPSVGRATWLWQQPGEVAHISNQN